MRLREKNEKKVLLRNKTAHLTSIFAIENNNGAVDAWERYFEIIFGKNKADSYLHSAPEPK